MSQAAYVEAFYTGTVFKLERLLVAGFVARPSTDAQATDAVDQALTVSLETWELLSYVVTVVGLPLAIAVFLYEQRRERDNEEEEVYQLLSDNYQDFLKMTLDNPDLKLFSAGSGAALNDEQRERQLILFNMLISLFERAYLLLYEDPMTPKQARRWHSWEDYMLEWCRRPDFRANLPRLLQGEDPDFGRYLERLAASAG